VFPQRTTYTHTDTQTHRHTDTQTHRHTDIKKNWYSVRPWLSCAIFSRPFFFRVSLGQLWHVEFVWNCGHNIAHSSILCISSATNIVMYILIHTVYFICIYILIYTVYFICDQYCYVYTHLYCVSHLRTIWLTLLYSSANYMAHSSILCMSSATTWCESNILI